MSQYELRAETLRHRSQRFALRLLKLAGWTVRYKPLPGPHGIIIVYPHTSNWDFVVGSLAKAALGLPFRWLGKETLFRGPMGRLMRKWGGLPVERGAPTGATTRLAQQMHAADWFWLAITPEGTRGYRPHWRSGFYHLAVEARVPVVMVYIDYANKELGMVDSMRPTGDAELDMATIAAVYRDRNGLYPQLAAPVKLAPAKLDDAGQQAG